MSTRQISPKDFDYSKLRGKITERFGNQRAFGKFLGKSDTYVTRYLTGLSEFSQSIIFFWAGALKIEPTEFNEYFFCLKD